MTTDRSIMQGLLMEVLHAYLPGFNEVEGREAVVAAMAADFRERLHEASGAAALKNHFCQVESMYGYAVNRPLVKLTLVDAEGIEGPSALMDPEDATELGGYLVSIAAKSMADGFIFEFIKDMNGNDEEAKVMAARVLASFRRFAQERQDAHDQQRAAELPKDGPG